MLRHIALTLSVLAALALGIGQAAAQARPPKGPVLVYETRRPALDVSITRRGDRIWRAGVSAPGVCDTGEQSWAGFGLIGGDGWPVGRDGSFHRPRGGIHTVFRGRFEGDKVVGVFFERRLEVGGGAEGYPPVCGNTRPRGRYQHFVAWLVERNHEKVPHPPIRQGS